MMLITLDLKYARDLSNRILVRLGFSTEDAELVTNNLIEAELVEKRTHGLVRLLTIMKQVEKNKINLSGGGKLDIQKRTGNYLLINGQKQSGFVVLYKSLEIAMSEVKKKGVMVVGIGNLAYATGYIGAYAREATSRNLIFLGLNSSPGGLVPYGAKKELWGTNPITMGIPYGDTPIILDMASSIITWGDLLMADNELRSLKSGVALDSEGDETTDPKKAMDGGLLPVGGHKGSGLALMVEMLAGALTGTFVDWASMYILIDPTVFGSMDKFRNEILTRIKALKSLPKAENFSTISFPGEESGMLRKQNLLLGKIGVEKTILGKLMI